MGQLKARGRKDLEALDCLAVRKTVLSLFRRRNDYGNFDVSAVIKAFRKLGVKGVWLGAALIGVVVVGGCSGDVVETTTNHYSNYKEAVADGALQRGWLPRNIPDDVHDIVETHNIDTNELWARFQFGQSDIESFFRQCEKAIDLRLPSAARTKRMAAWWPETFTDKKGEQLPDKMQAYRCPGMPHAESEFDAGMVVDAEERAAWYWVALSQAASPPLSSAPLH